MSTPLPSSLPKALSAAALVLLLSACGGGGDDEPAPEPSALDAVPSTASGSSGGFADYLKKLVMLQPEDREPVSLEGVQPPADDTGEPAPTT